ncbi:SAM-dependent methyltransferase [Streptomyces odontomachi]|uniref:SAM-dependent methyltransferase n=1 Tax=Streptomyces odontomachi TaxID=2944940 RepID=UPI00210A6833|nr:SAM-dependent methyltransferase [Streptomyces sp. ODS25]
MTAGMPKPQVDTSKPHPARVYDFMLGGKDHYRVDVEVGEQLPPIAVRGAQLNRDFMHRAVRWVAGQGIDQFLDIGAGIPTEPNLHQVAQEIQPHAKVAYTDNDPIVLRHAEALLVGTGQGATDYIQADVREPGQILQYAAEVLDFERPIALSLLAVMHFVTDEEDPYGITRALVDALPPGSYLIFSHATWDMLPEVRESVEGAYNGGGIKNRVRTHPEIERFFTGLDLVPPGLVNATEWYRDTPAPTREATTMYAGVARVHGARRRR